MDRTLYPPATDPATAPGQVTVPCSLTHRAAAVALGRTSAYHDCSRSIAGVDPRPVAIVKEGAAHMRFEIGRSLIVFIWTNNRYREEVVRLFQGINRRSIRLLRARKLLGLCFLAVRRVGAAAAR